MKVTVRWLVAVVGRCVVGCEHCEGYCSTVAHMLNFDATWRCEVSFMFRPLYHCNSVRGRVSTIQLQTKL